MMVEHKDRREHTVHYLMQMATELQKMADGAMIPSLSLLFAMAADEAEDFIGRHYPKTQEVALFGQQRDKAAAVADKPAGKIKLHQGEIEL